MNLPPTVIYVLSAGHSGSTLIPSIIGNHTKAFNAGEIAYLSRFLNRPGQGGEICSCGAAAVLKCPFWRSVDARLQDSGGLRGLKIGLSKGDTADDRRLFSAIAAVADASVIVDTSKNYRRLRRLMKDGEIRVLPVFLLVDPRKIVYSMRGRLGYIKYALRLNRLGLRMRKAFRVARALGLDPVVMHYDQFVENPAKTAETIVRRAGLTFEEKMLDWGRSERHDLGGNAMKRGKDSIITKDERWRTGMRPLEQATIIALSPIYQLVSRMLMRQKQAVD